MRLWDSPCVVRLTVGRDSDVPEKVFKCVFGSEIVQVWIVRFSSGTHA